MQPTDLKTRVFGELIVHSNSNGPAIVGKNIKSNKGPVRYEVTTEDIKNFYSTLMQDNEQQKPLDKRRILIDNKDFKTDFLTLKNAQLDIREAL